MDASAILAFLRDEPGKDVVESCLDHALISAVNLSEVAAKLSEYGMAADKVSEALSVFVLWVIPFDADQALLAGALRADTRARGLSLGDSACLALAQTSGRIAMTADRAWTDLNVGVTIEVIR